MSSKKESHEKYTVWIGVSQAARLRLLFKMNKFREATYVEKLIERGMPPREARVRGMRRRARWWPPVTSVVAAAIRERLAEDDLRGPWAPLTSKEEEQMRLSGRWPGHNLGGLRQRNYELPSSLLRQLRTAAWRVSEKPLAELEEEGLTHYSMDLTMEEVEKREELIEQVYAPPRIVREALERYGPKPAEGDEGEGE